MTTPEDRIRRLLVDSLDAELGSRLDAPDTLPGLVDRPPPRSRRTARWALPAVAAAAVIGIAVGVVAVVGGSGTAPTPPSRTGGTVVTCTASGSGDVARDRAELLARARSVGGDAASVEVHGRSVELSVPGAGNNAVSTLCASTSLELRPDVAPAVPNADGDKAHPLANLGFTAPTTEAGYDQLTSTQQQTLAGRLRHADCRPAPPESTAPVVACGPGPSGGRFAHLLGASVVDGGAVTSASASAPGQVAAATDTSWSVLITLDRQGATAWSRFTGRHHVQNLESASSASVTSCSSAQVPCEDFVAFTGNGRVLSDALTTARLGAQTQVSGTFTERAARRLADGLGSHHLPVPLHLVSTRPLH